MNNQNGLDDQIMDLFMEACQQDIGPKQFVDGIKAAINKTIMKDALAIVGEDEPETELKPFSDGNGNVGTVLGRNVARNELRAELRQQITTRYGRADNE